MVLSERQLVLFSELLQQRTWISMEELSHKIGVSERTVSSDLEVLDDYMRPHSCNILRQPGRGVWLDAHEMKRSLLLQQISEVRTQLQNPLWTLLIHLIQHEWTTLDHLSDVLHVSRPVVTRYIQTLMDSLRQFEISIESRRGKGVRLQGRESAYRRILQRLLLDGDFLCESSSIVNAVPSMQSIKLMLDILMPGFPVDAVAEITEEVQDETNQPLTDEAFINIVTFTSLALIRMLQGHRHSTSSERLFDEVCVDTWKPFVNKLAKKFRLDPVSVQHELDGLETYIQLSTSNMSTTEHNRIGNIIDSLCHSLESFLAIPFSRDQKLVDSLTLHIRTALMRRQLEQVRRNPILDQIKREYPEIYFCLRDTAETFNQDEKELLNSDELGFLTMHFAASLMRNAWLVNVGFITAQAASMTEISVSKLLHEFPGLNIEVVPVHRVERDRSWLEHMDIIISNTFSEPVSQLTTSVVHVNSWITEGDIRRFHHALNRVLQTPIRNGEEPFHSSGLSNNDLRAILQSAYWNPTVDEDKIDNIIKCLAAPLIQAGYCTDDFVMAVLQREQLGASCIEDGIAIPHSLLDWCPNGLVVSGGRLKKPVKWGDLYVDLVFLMGVRRNSGGIFLQFYDWLKRMFPKLRETHANLQHAACLAELEDWESLI